MSSDALLAVYPHLAQLKSEPPKDPSRYSLARTRANEVFAEFTRSAEYAALDDGARWSTLVMRSANVRHGVTIDELNADVLRDVAAQFVAPNDVGSLSHWVAVVHEELVAFFRFLARKGFAHAAANISLLEDEVLPAVDARFKEACAADVTITPLDQSALDALLASGMFTRPQSTPLRPIDPSRRARRRAQRNARRKNR